MALVSTLGRMVDNTKVTGIMENNMAKVFTDNQLELNAEVNGKTVSVLHG